MTAGVHTTRVPLVLEEHYKYKDTFSTPSMLNLLDEQLKPVNNAYTNF